MQVGESAGCERVKMTDRCWELIREFDVTVSGMRVKMIDDTEN